MANILLLIEDDFEDVEAMYPYYRMQEAGHQVTVVGNDLKTYHSKHGYPLKADTIPSQVHIEDFKGIIIPGGYAPDRMRTKTEMVRLVKEANDKGLIIGAICHAAQVLIEAAIVRGKKATCYISVKTDLVNAGAMYIDTSVVVDGKLVTSRHPGDLPDFCRNLVDLFGKAEALKGAA